VYETSKKYGRVLRLKIKIRSNYVFAVSNTIQLIFPNGKLSEYNFILSTTSTWRSNDPNSGSKSTYSTRYRYKARGKGKKQGC
jgi:hypothetical protein